MKKIILLILIILSTMFAVSCNSKKANTISLSTDPTTTVSPKSQEVATQPEIKNKYSNIGICFSSYNTKTSYNGYTYELMRSKEESTSDYKSMLYRYKDVNSKEELYDFDGYGVGVYGIFVDNYLYYVQPKPRSLKRMNLNTLTTETLESDNGSISGMFQYDNYIFLPCGDNIIRVEILTDIKKVVISSRDLDDFDDIRAEYVFACNDKLYIVRRYTYKEDNKVFCSNLDGSNLSYAGFSIPNFYGIASVNEATSEIEYYTNYNMELKGKERKKISLKGEQ